MKKIIFAFSCVFLMSGVAVADGRYEVVALGDGMNYVIVDTKKEKIKYCKLTECTNWFSWDSR